MPISSYSKGDGTLSKELQSLLLLHPSEIEVRKKVVLTTLPRLWTGVNTSEEILVIDLSSILGVRGLPWDVSEASVVENLIENLTERGWPAKWIKREYRSDFRSRGKIDVAVFDETNVLQLAVEVKRPEFMSPQVVREAFEQLSATVNAKWHCVTDGEQFRILNTVSGEMRATEQLPSPADLGLNEVGIGAKPKLKQIILTPSKPEEMTAFVSQQQPQGVVFDQHLPFGMLAAHSSTAQSGNTSLSVLLPEKLPPIRGRVEATHMLMAWAGSIPSVTTISGIAPSSFMRAQAYDWLRQYLHARLRLCGIIELPPDLFRPIGLTTTLFYLGGTREGAYFDVLPSRGDLIGMEARPWFDSLSRWMKGKEPTTGYTVNVTAQTVWAAGPNDPALERIYERLSRFGELLSLGELCEIRRGIPLGRNRELSENGIPYLQGRNIREGYINFEDTGKIPTENIPDWAFLRSGDLLMPEVVTERSSVVLNQSREPGILSHNIIVLRPLSDRVSAEYLVEYLNSSTAQKLILANASRLGGLHRISPAFLRELNVPLVEPELFQGLNETKEVESELRAKADELGSTRRSLFDSENGQVFRDKIGVLKRGGKLLATSLQSAARLEFQIANFYPFPIAYSFRLLASIVNPAELYKEQLRVAENLLAFIASVSLSIMQKKDLEDAEISLRDYWQGGISPGDWKAITARCSKVFSTYKDMPLASSIQRLNIGSEKKGFGATAKLLVERL